MEIIGLEDLACLAEIAKKDRESFFESYPRWSALYRGRLIAVALCQGAALHFLNRTNGVKDFDVWSFYAATDSDPKRAFMRRAVKSVDFGVSRFGNHPDFPAFQGRKVDLLDRVLQRKPNEESRQTLRRYLTEQKTKSSYMLAQKAMVFIDPPEHLGDVIWPEV
jgi:hypothetical protein